MGSKVFLYTLGCRLNHAETEILAQRLQDAGYTLADHVEEADLCLVNTCTVTGEADAKSRKMVRALIRRNPRARMCVTGCHAQIRPEAMATIPGVDVVIGNADKLDLAAWLPHAVEGAAGAPYVLRNAIKREPFVIPKRATMPPVCRPQIKIQDGCDGHCSFCVVPHARGASRGRPLEDIVEEARFLAAHGALEVVVTGLNVGAYACNGTRLADVLDAIDAIGGIQRIRIGSIELAGIDDGLAARMADPGHALVPFLHIPLQSASETVLTRMNRNYRAAAFGAWLDRLANDVPDICLGTDILVGFPGESEAEFDTTCRFLEQSPLAYAHVFKYSDREDTPATRMPEKIAPPCLNARSERIRLLSESKWNAYLERFLGRTVEVLFETRHGDFWAGYSAHYIQVLSDSPRVCSNRLLRVRLDRIDGDHMIGEVL